MIYLEMEIITNATTVDMILTKQNVVVEMELIDIVAIISIIT